MHSSRRRSGRLRQRGNQAYSKNIDGVTKAAAEDDCQLFDREPGLFCIVLNPRFFPEEDHNQVDGRVLQTTRAM